MLSKAFFALGLLLVIGNPCCRCTKNVNKMRTDILETLVMKDHSETLILPGNSTGGPMIVETNIVLKSIEKFDEVAMEITYSFILRLQWNDYRLKYDNANLFKYIPVKDNFDLIWTPDIYFSGAKKVRTNEIPSPNYFTRIHPNGTVLTSRRVTVTHKCDMDLRNFPFDSQVCPLKITTYGSTTEDIIMKWHSIPVGFNKDLKAPSPMQLIRIVSGSKVFAAMTGNYSDVYVEFFFSRNLNHYLIRCYVPCCMLVLLSWLTFWFNDKNVAFRVAVCLGNLYVMTLAIQEHAKELPKLSYNTSLDCFTGTCLTFALLAVVLHVLLDRVVSNDRSSVTSAESPKEDRDGEEGVNGTRTNVGNGADSSSKGKRGGAGGGETVARIKRVIEKLKNNPAWIENAVRIAYISLFVLFCIAYFTGRGILEKEQDSFEVHKSP